MATRQWFFEVRANFANKEKNDVVEQLLKNMASDVNASLCLLADGAPIEVLLYSDDFMLGRKQLEWLAAKKTVTVTENTVQVTEDPESTEQISDEMLEALQSLRKMR